MNPIRLFCLAASLMLLLPTGTQGQGFERETLLLLRSSYPPLPDVEPRISQEESRLFQDLAGDLERGDFATGIRRLSASLRPDSSAALDFALGNLYFQQEQPLLARRAYEEAIRKHGSFRRAFRNLGLLHSRQGQYAEAVEALGKAVSLGDKDSGVYGILGYCHLQMGHALAAETAYRQALLFEPQSLVWREGLVHALQGQERHRECVGILEELLRLDGEKSAYWLLQANAWVALNEPMAAATHLEMARRLGGATPRSLALLGDILINEGMTELALDAWLEALSMSGELPLQQPLRATEALALRGEHEAALTLLERLRSRYVGQLQETDRRRMAMTEARLLVAREEHALAVKLLEEVLEAFPLDGAALLLSGEALEGLGQTERARYEYQRAAALAGHEAQASLALARLEAREGHYDLAADLLRRVLVLEPSRRVEEFLARIERVRRAL